MVRAILDGKKTVTRRCVPGKIILNAEREHTVTFFPCKTRKDKRREIRSIKYFTLDSFTEYEAPYQFGDILYVRETWQYLYELDGNEQIIEGTGKYYYAASDTLPFDTYVDSMGATRENIPWRPSIHMPKEAARIWLKVTDVRVERLKEMDCEDAMKEGIDPRCCINLNHTIVKFAKLWNSTIKKSDLDRYGWDANPYVFVIEFQKCEKPESEEKA